MFVLRFVLPGPVGFTPGKSETQRGGVNSIEKFCGHYFFHGLFSVVPGVFVKLMDIQGFYCYV
jgi:hypothetical protein